jgi:hypothetical protein
MTTHELVHGMWNVGGRREKTADGWSAPRHEGGDSPNRAECPLNLSNDGIDSHNSGFKVIHHDGSQQVEVLGPKGLVGAGTLVQRYVPKGLFAESG